jgi:hypothetical protein
MKHKFLIPLLLVLLTAMPAFGQAGAVYTNFIRQVQLPTNVIWDLAVQPSGEVLSPLAIDPGGARYELWTVKSDPLTVYLLDTKYVGTYVPIATVNIYTEDPNTFNAIPRTRADRPFVVDVITSGLSSDENAPAAAKSVTLLRHVQSYGVRGGDGTTIDPSQATLYHQVTLNDNATHRLTYNLTSIPGNNRAKVRGEERFSVYSVADYQSPEAQLASKTVQIWPVANGSITGITSGAQIRYKLPQITLNAQDLYPDSRAYAQVYRGEVRDGVTGTLVRSLPPVWQAVPKNAVLAVDDWDATIPEDGRWTLEFLTSTPFGIDRLAYVSFDVDRTMKVKGTFVTSE